MIVYQLGICCVYIVFVATNIKSVADYYIKPIDVRLYMLILLLPLILINYIRNLKRLAPFSTLANVITFVGLGIVLYYIFDQLPSIKTVEYVGTLKGYPLYVGTTLFALEAVGVVSKLLFSKKNNTIVFISCCDTIRTTDFNPIFSRQIIALENNMETPKSFGGYFGVLNRGMTVIVILYVLVGFFGYIKYGERSAGSVTLNLPSEEV